uniref:Uncharacterized protein n=1 Tax=Oryza sativa subsp. japonica TaxID=39947 RepID=Q69KT6_ORYSJ|nr:hypothetical protein [Oryza sativa Japonica Group]BAD34170.1 hypothetical protein [Oryza sativa Japonica Group]
MDEVGRRWTFSKANEGYTGCGPDGLGTMSRLPSVYRGVREALEKMSLVESWLIPQLSACEDGAKAAGSASEVEEAVKPAEKKQE